MHHLLEIPSQGKIVVEGEQIQLGVNRKGGPVACDPRQVERIRTRLGSLFAGWQSLRESLLWPFLCDGFWYVAIALVISVGAYVGEVIRAGLRGVPKGDTESARAMGMRSRFVIHRVRLPSAIQILLPTLAGETVILLKSTALASTVAVMDVLGAANYMRAQTLRTYEPLLAVAIIYVVLAFVSEKAFGCLEHCVPVRSSRLT